MQNKCFSGGRKVNREGYFSQGVAPLILINERFLGVGSPTSSNVDII